MATPIEIYREGKQLKAEKKFDEALPKLREAYQGDESLTVALHAIVQCLTELERHQEAIEEAKKLTEIEPNDQFSFIALSRAYQRAGMIPEAEYAMMQGQQVAMRG